MKNKFEKKVLIGKIFIDNVDWSGALGRVENLVDSGRKAYAVTPNVDHVVLAEQDPYFLKIYREADLVIPDGMALLWAARFLGTPLREKISGSDFLIRFSSPAAARGYRVFYLGGKAGAAAASAEILTKKFPGLNVVGTCDPPLGFELERQSNSRVIDEINRSGCDIIFVGLGTPKQEKWIYENRRHYEARMSFPVGAGFDFVSGKSRRAPLWMQQSGMEWFWRLSREPVRLGRRYLIRDLKFLPLICRQKAEGKR